jgi:hypothetical protein
LRSGLLGGQSQGSNNSGTFSCSYLTVVLAVCDVAPSRWKTKYCMIRQIFQKWEEIPQDQIDRAIDEFRPRLKKVVEVVGNHIEQFFL